MTRRSALALWLVGSLGFLAACLLVEQGLADASLYSDVHVYERYAAAMANGDVPYRDFSDEYPPLAQPIFLLGYVAGAAHYALAFKAAMTLCGIGALGCAVFTLRAVRAPLASAAALTTVFAAAPLLTGPIFLNAYDLWPVFLLSLALLLLVRGRTAAAFAVLGAAIAAKVYPVAVLPIALLSLVRVGRMRAFLTCALVWVVIHLPFAALGPGGLRYSYATQARRGLELNSLGAAFLLLAGHPRTGNEPPGSLNVLGGTADAVATLSTFAVVAAIAAAAVAFVRGRPLLVASAAAVTGFVAFDKVFSAQYVEWLLPVAPLAGLDAAAGTVAALVLTRLVFSHRDAIEADREIGLLLARDLVVVALFALLLLRPRRLRS